jgi:tRNA(fMet)-specific endonuclease VapC
MPTRLYLLDTDHLSLIQREDNDISVRFLATPREELAASVVSFEEQMRGWLSYIKQARKPEQACRAYAWLCRTQRFYCTLQLLEFDPGVSAIYEALCQAHRRLGRMDLRIAATALSIDATLVTRNTKDFISIANLRLDNWA